MGQRHQAFLIASIGGSYRCVAALHHQWCYGRLPLRATRRFLTLAKQPLNASIIRDEFRRMRLAGAKLNARLPSQYLANLLSCAFNAGLEEEDIYVSYGSQLDWAFLPADMGCWGGDNNDGLTIIDITDPEHAAYGFLPGYETGEDKSGSAETIMNAERYCRCYYPLTDSEKPIEDEEEKDVKAVIASLSGEPLLTADALVGTWPREFKKGPATAKSELDPSQATQPETASPALAPVPSLADLALLPALKHALAENDITGIENLLWMPGKASALITIFKSKDFNPFPDAALPLLHQALGQLADTKLTLDLSHLPLSDDQILSLVKEVEGLKKLDLSHNLLVTSSTVRSVLSAVPGLKSLILLNTSVPPRDWRDLLEEQPKLFYNIDSVVHVSFYGAKNAFFPDAFCFMPGPKHPYDYNRAPPISIPFFTPTLIVESLIQLFPNEAPDADLCTSVAPTVAFSHEVLADGKTWGERSIPFFARETTSSLKGKSWIFYYSIVAGLVGFVKVSQREETDDQEGKKYVVEVFDLEGFLEEMEKEGRPKAPENKVKLLSETFTKLTADIKNLGSHRPPTRHYLAESDQTKWLSNEQAQEIFLKG